MTNVIPIRRAAPVEDHQPQQQPPQEARARLEGDDLVIEVPEHGGGDGGPPQTIRIILELPDLPDLPEVLPPEPEKKRFGWGAFFFGALLGWLFA